MVQHTAIVLAAGFSTRMGQCKASLPWGTGQSLLAYQVTQFLAAGVAPLVVLGSHNADLKDTCPSACAIAINPTPSQGKVSSILTGLEFLSEGWESEGWDGVFISAVDQPRPAWVYERLVQAFQAARLETRRSPLITAPTHQGRMGHPLLFSSELLSQLQSIREETLGLRRVVQQYAPSIRSVDVGTSIVLTDLNTPERYHAALAASQ